MKRLFLFGCLMLMAINAMAYQPMLVEGRIWNVLVYGGFTGIDSIDNLPPTSYYYKVDGDSVIDGEVYKKIYKSSDKINWEFEYVMMENAEEGKVWKYGYSYLNQGYYKDLIIDFSLNVGDSFKESYNVCENIKYVKDKRGNVLKRMEMGMNMSCWIEGYGYEYMILDGLSFYLSSVEDEDGVLIDFSEVTDAYVPMVVEGYSWNVVSSYLQMFPDTKKYSTQKQLIEGDSGC